MWPDIFPQPDMEQACLQDFLSLRGTLPLSSRVRFDGASPYRTKHVPATVVSNEPTTSRPLHLGRRVARTDVRAAEQDAPIAALALRRAVLDPRLQRRVHLLEADFGLRQRALDEVDEDAAEALGLDEAAAATLEWLDPEAVLAVKEAREKQTPEPAQLAIRFHGPKGRLERHRPGVRRLDSDLEPRALAEFAADPADERIPLRVGRQVAHDRPHTFRWRIDLDLSSELTHLQDSSTRRRLLGTALGEKHAR